MRRRKIRVLQLIDGLGLGGAERVVALLAMHSDRERFEVIPCALQCSGPLESELKTADVPYRVLGIPRRSVLTGPFFVESVRRSLAALTQTLQDLSIDIVHTHLADSTLLGILAARRVGVVGICATVHNVIHTRPRGSLSPRGWLMRLTMNNVLSKADRIIAVSEAVVRTLQSRPSLPQDKIVMIPNGVESDRFHVASDRRSLRCQLRLPLNRPVVVSVGRLTRQKGYPHLQDALASMSGEQRPLILIAGDGPDRGELEARTLSKGLGNDIRFLGSRNDIPALLAAADLFVLPSLWEGMPLVLLEAMAAGLPMVATAVGGNTEVVEHGVSGLLVPAAEPQALAHALTVLINDPMQRERMGRAARERYDRKYSVQRFIKAHEILYEDLLTRPDCAAPQAEVT